MSDDLLKAIRKNSKRHQSPIDDFFSFYYVVQWAAVFNNREFAGKFGGQVPFELSSLRSSLSRGVNHRGNVLLEIHRSLVEEKSYGQFLARCKPFMEEWDNSLVATNLVWTRKFRSYADKPLENLSNTYLALFRELTSQLVIDTLKIARKHLATLPETEAV
jgi:hypothetical protein